MATVCTRRESPKTREMHTSPTSSTPKHSRASVEPPKTCELLALPSTTPPIPSSILPPASSHFEHPHRNFNTVRLQNFPTSSLATSPKTGQLPPSTRSTPPLSPHSNIPEIHRPVHMVRQQKNGTSICNSHQKLYFRPETSRTTLSAPFTQHQLQLSFPTRNIPLL